MKNRPILQATAIAAALAVVPLAAAVGDTGMTKLALAPTANPLGIVHVTTCPLLAQPAGTVPSVRLAGTVSLTVASAVVAEPPVFVTVSV